MLSTTSTPAATRSPAASCADRVPRTGSSVKLVPSNLAGLCAEAGGGLTGETGASPEGGVEGDSRDCGRSISRTRALLSDNILVSFPPLIRF